MDDLAQLRERANKAWYQLDAYESERDRRDARYHELRCQALAAERAYHQALAVSSCPPATVAS